MKTLRGAQAGNPFLWALTGTPWEVSPNDIGTYINLLEERVEYSWTPSRREESGETVKDGFYYTRKEKFDMIIRDHGILVDLAKTRRQIKLLRENFADRFGKVLRDLMIRRTTDSKWYGAPIVKLKPNIHKNIGCEPIAEFVEDLEMERDNTQAGLRAAISKQQARQGAQEIVKRRAIDTLRMAITTPYIARLRRQMAEGRRAFFNWSLMAREIDQNDWYDVGVSK
jgi:hypothetical protein